LRKTPHAAINFFELDANFFARLDNRLGVPQGHAISIE
jgi:hypothetical protein